MYLAHCFEHLCIYTRRKDPYWEGHYFWDFDFTLLKHYQTSFIRFKANFLDRVAKYHEHYHMFILAKYQEETWKEICQAYGIEKYIVYAGPPCFNKNYPDEEGRIRLIILKFPPDYKDVPYEI